MTDTSQHQPPHKGHMKIRDLNAQVVINNNLATVLADTGASISVCGREQAQIWNLLPRIFPTTTKIKPYNSPTIYQSLELPNALSRSAPHPFRCIGT